MTPLAPNAVGLSPLAPYSTDGVDKSGEHAGTKPSNPVTMRVYGGCLLNRQMADEVLIWICCATLLIAVYAYPTRTTALFVINLWF